MAQANCSLRSLLGDLAGPDLWPIVYGTCVSPHGPQSKSSSNHILYLPYIFPYSSSHYYLPHHIAGNPFCKNGPPAYMVRPIMVYHKVCWQALSTLYLFSVLCTHAMSHHPLLSQVELGQHPMQVHHDTHVVQCTMLIRTPTPHAFDCHRSMCLVPITSSTPLLSPYVLHPHHPAYLAAFMPVNWP